MKKYLLTLICIIALFGMNSCIEKNQEQAKAAELAGEMQEALDNGDMQRAQEVKNEAKSWFNSLSSDDQQQAKDAYNNYQNSDSEY